MYKRVYSSVFVQMGEVEMALELKLLIRGWTHEEVLVMVLFMFKVLMKRVVEVLVAKLKTKADLRMFEDSKWMVVYGWWAVRIMGRYTVELWTVADKMKSRITMRSVNHTS